jgi:hypothetical protein
MGVTAVPWRYLLAQDRVAPVSEAEAPGGNAAAKDVDEDSDDAGQPAITLKPGRNLVGEKIAEYPVEPHAAEPSVAVQRIIDIINQTLDLSLEQANLENQRRNAIQQHQQKKIELSQLPDRYKASSSDLLAMQLKMNSLYGAIKFGPRNEQYQQYFQLQELANATIAKVKLLEQMQQSLPIEMRNLATEAERLHQNQTDNARTIDELEENWSKVLSVFAYLPKQDATLLVQTCESRLVQHPDSAPLHVIQGLCHIQLSQLRAAIERFNRAMESMEGTSSKLRVPCLIGIAWARLEAGELDEAAATIAAAKELSSRHYELTICEAQLAHLRGHSSVSFSTYRRAAAIKPRQSTAYRMSAIMVAKTKIRPPEISLDLAEKAIELDEFGDFRNSIAVAYAHHALGNLEARDAAIETAKSRADEAARETVDLMIADLMNTK